MLGVSVHGFEDFRKNTPSIQSFFGAATTAKPASGGSSGLSSIPPLPPSFPRKPAARTSSSSGGSSSKRNSSRPNGLGFPTAPAKGHEAGVKRRRPWGGAEEGTGGGAAVPRRAEAAISHAGAGGDDEGARGGGGDGSGGGGGGGSGGGGGGSGSSRPGEGVSVVPATGSDDDHRQGETGGGRGAGGGTVGLREKGGGGQGEFGSSGGGGGGCDDGVWCVGVRDRDTGTGEERAKATGGPEGSGDDGVKFCRVIQGSTESSDPQACEVVLPKGGAGVREDANAAANAAGEECLVVDGCGQSHGEGRQGKRSSRVLEDAFSADANEQPRAKFGRGGASGVFGEVDPGVLAELPPEIQREIWMQQVRLWERLCLAVGSKLLGLLPFTVVCSSQTTVAGKASGVASYLVSNSARRKAINYWRVFVRRPLVAT